MRNLPLVICLPLIVAGSVAAQPALTLTNQGPEAYMPVVEVPAPPTGCASLVGPDGARSPVQQLPDGRWLAAVTGVVGTGESVALKPDARPGATDLQVEETEGEITVRNSFLALTFPRKGGGGLPVCVGFPVSGQVTREFQWYDRIYAADKQQFLLKDDPEATATVVQRGPLEVTLEARARFVSGNVAIGGNSAVYRWTFRACTATGRRPPTSTICPTSPSTTWILEIPAIPSALFACCPTTWPIRS